jgi:hypothetical protein
MRRLLIVCIYLTAALSFLIGCSSREEGASDSIPVKKEEAKAQGPVDPGKKGNEIFIFRAKYYQTDGPCIFSGSTVSMPIVDAFQIIEVVKGDLKAKGIIVRALSECGPGYPKELAVGKVYTLCLTPSERTKQQLLELPERPEQPKRPEQPERPELLEREELQWLLEQLEYEQESDPSVWVDGDEIQEQKADKQ